MNYSDNSTPHYHLLPNLADPPQLEVRFRLQVAQYVVVACLTVNLHSTLFTSLGHI